MTEQQKKQEIELKHQALGQVCEKLAQLKMEEARLHKLQIAILQSLQEAEVQTVEETSNEEAK